MYVEDYRGDIVQVDESYSGVAEVEVDQDVIDEIYDSGKAVIPELEGIINQYLVLKGPGSASASGPCGGRGLGSDRRPRAGLAAPLRHRDEEHQTGVCPHDLLLDPDVAAVSLMGMAGTGKTFLSLAAAPRAGDRAGAVPPCVGVPAPDCRRAPGGWLPAG